MPSRSQRRYKAASSPSDYINIDLQFDKSYVDPLQFIMEAIGWEIDRSYGTQRTLEALFG